MNPGLPRRIYAAALDRLERWFGLKVFFIYRRALAAGQSVPVSVEQDYTFKEMAENDLLQVADDPALQLSADFIRAAARRGDVCFGVLHRSRLVAYRWYAVSGSTPCEDGLSIQYAYPGRAYGFKTFTHPEHRGKRLHVYTMMDSDSHLARRGYTHTVGYIDARNSASLRAYSRLNGANVVGVVACVRILGRRCIVRSPGAARNRVSIKART